MKTPMAAIAIPALIAAAIITICGISLAGQRTEENNEATSKDVKRETMEAIQALKNYSVKQSDDAVKEAKAALEDMDARIERLQNRIERKWDEMDQSSREKVRKAITALRKKRNELSEWYGGLKHSSASAWNHVKEGFVEGYESLSKAFDNAENEFSADESGKSSD